MLRTITLKKKKSDAVSTEAGIDSPFPEWTSLPANAIHYPVAQNTKYSITEYSAIDYSSLEYKIQHFWSQLMLIASCYPSSTAQNTKYSITETEYNSIDYITTEYTTM